MKISVFGCGAWGSAIAKLLAQNGHDVLGWAYEEKTVNDINNDQVNHDFLPGIFLPRNFRATNSVKEAIEHSSIWVSVLPSQILRKFYSNLQLPNINIQFISASKGIEIESGKLVHEVLEETLPKNFDCYYLSGPSFAKEVALEQPTLVTIAGKDESKIRKHIDLFRCEYFRPYMSSDIVGVELGGSLKNVIAIASGIAEGIGYRINSQSALLTRALGEMTKLGIQMGGSRETFGGLSGMGDLILTCLGSLSRNKQLGIYVGAGMKASEVIKKQKTIAEGYYTSKAVMKLIEKYNIELPILTTVYKILYEDLSPDEGLKFLMNRPTKWE